MLLSNTKEGAINSDRGGQGGQDDIKASLENKDFTRQKREQRDARQKEQHEPLPGKAQGKRRERELAQQRCLFWEGNGPGETSQQPCVLHPPLGSAGGTGRCVRPEQPAQVLWWSACAGQACGQQDLGQKSCFCVPAARSTSNRRPGPPSWG